MQPITIEDESAFKPAAPVTIEDEGAFKSDEPAKRIGRFSAAAKTTLSGVTASLSDELHGVDRSIAHVLKRIISGGKLDLKEIKGAYTTGRDEERRALKQAHEEYPVQSVATEVLGGVATPLPALGAVKAVGLGRKAYQAAKVGAAYGAVSGVGMQEGKEGQIATVDDNLTGAAKGALVGAAGSVALAGAGAGVGKLLSRRPEKVKAGIMDQIARANDKMQATPTSKKHLQKAGNAIYDEVVKGPDGAAVLKAVQAPAATKGIEWLEPVLKRVNARKEAGYRAFTKAGKDVVPMPDYITAVMKAAEKARVEGDSRMADGLEGVAHRMWGETEKTAVAGGQATLKWLRKHTTTFQDAAASKLGGLQEHEAHRVAVQVAGRARDVFDEMLGNAAGKDPALMAAAKKIRGSNRRLYGLITMKETLENRALKEGVPGGFFETAAKKVVGVAGTGGALAGGLLGGAPGAAAGALIGAAAVPAARAFDRSLNSMAITRLRAAAAGKGPRPNAAIKSLSQELGLPERQLRAAYVRMVLGGDDAEQP